MTQVAKRWLRRKTKTSEFFTADKQHGGIVGSLVGLGYVERKKNTYYITDEGKRWLGYDNRKI